jgi:beta-phosphoglucomutase-like phosphatase (HAD superfamily)
MRATGLNTLIRANFFSGDDVLNRKPAPDLYLLASEFMGVPLDRCIAIEDSPSGISAARAAGIFTIGFCGGSHYSDRLKEQAYASGAHEVIGSLLDLCDA